MKYNIHGDKIKVTESIRSYVESKLSHLDKYFEHPENITATITLRVKGHVETIEVTVPTTDFTLRREESNDDLYAAIDLVVDKLERQIRKNKTRFLKRYKDVPNSEFIFTSIADAEEKLNKIVKRKELDVKPMTEDEAILQAELLDHDFFIFKNADNGLISVLYLRKDGNYGIIDIK